MPVAQRTFIGRGAAGSVPDDSYPGESERGWFARRRAAGQPGRVGVSRLLVFELVQFGLFFAIAQQLWVAILGCVLGTVAIAVTFGRADGRWWTDSVLLSLRYRRRKGVIGQHDDDPRIAALRVLEPAISVENIDGTAGTPLGMASDGGGWFTVLEVEEQGEVHPPIPLRALAAVARDAEQPGVVIQVVSQTVEDVAATGNARPVDPRTMDPGAAPTTARAVSSGRGHEHGTAVRGPARRKLWVTVRLDAQAVADSMIDEPVDEVDIPPVLAEITRRARRVLDRRGVRHQALEADEVLEALALSCDLTPVGGEGTPASEMWDAWYSTHLAHGCFWLKTWPGPDRGTEALAALSEIPGANVNIALVLEPQPEETAVRCLVRVATISERYRSACARAVDSVAAVGGELCRLDGEHAPAVYASAPTGGGAR